MPVMASLYNKMGATTFTKFLASWASPTTTALPSGLTARHVMCAAGGAADAVAKVVSGRSASLNTNLPSAPQVTSLMVCP